MQENNVSKTVRNSGFSVIAQVLVLVLYFINRRVFVQVLDIEFLGYQSLFQNILSLLSVAELGIVNVISFHLYKELAEHNENEIGKLMYIYKWMYRGVAIVVMVAGTACFFLLPFLIEKENADWNFLRLIYALQLGAVVAGYFLSYRRTIFFADQKEYQCIKIELKVQMIIQISQILGLLLFRNYILYLVINLSTSLISNAIIAARSNVEYPFLKKNYHVTLEDIKKRNMFKDMANMLIHKISIAVYNGTDNIVITKFCGVRAVALYGNYYMLQTGVLSVALYSLLNPVQATIGTILNEKREKSDLWEQFMVFDIFSFFFASYISYGFFIFYQPVITLWMGEQFLLSKTFVLLNVCTIYWGVLWEIVCKYRVLLGDYAMDRNFAVVSAVLNLLISIVAAKHIGIEGVQLGTLIAYAPIGVGRVYCVVKKFFEKSLSKYLLKHLLLFCVFSAECIVTIKVTKYISLSFCGFVILGIIWLVVPGAVGIIIFGRSVYFKRMLVYLQRILQVIYMKFKNNC